MAIKYDEKTGSYSRLNEQGKNLGTVTRDDSLGRYEGIAAEYRAQQAAKQAAPSATIGNPSGYDKYRETAEQYNNAIKAAKAQAVEAQVQSMTNQIVQAKQQTEAANAEAYAAKRISEKNIGQQLAAAGLGSGGVAESTRLQNELNWQNAVNSNNQKLAEAERSIQNQIAQYRAQAAAEDAALDSRLGSELNQVYLQQLAEERADRQYQEQMAYQRQRDAVADMQYQQSLAADKQAADRSLALQLLGLGYNTEQIARTLGLTQAEIAVMLNGQTAGTTGTKRSGGTGGSGGSTDDDTPTEPTGPDENTMVVNSEGSRGDWVAVRGFGRLSWSELEKLVNQGAVREIYDAKTNTMHYVKVG